VSNSGSYGTASNMLEQLSAANAFARAAAGNNGGSDSGSSYQQLLAGLEARSIPVSSAASSLSSTTGSGSFWEKDFKLFANSMTSQSLDTNHTQPPTTSLSLTTTTDPIMLPGAVLPPTLTPSPSLHTPSPGIAIGQHTPSPSLGYAPSSPSTPGGSLGGQPTPSPGGVGGQEAAQLLWARYLESTLQQPGS